MHLKPLPASRASIPFFQPEIFARIRWARRIGAYIEVISSSGLSGNYDAIRAGVCFGLKNPHDPADQEFCALPIKLAKSKFLRKTEENEQQLFRPVKPRPEIRRIRQIIEPKTAKVVRMERYRRSTIPPFRPDAL